MRAARAISAALLALTGLAACSRDDSRTVGQGAMVKAIDGVVDVDKQLRVEPRP